MELVPYIEVTRWVMLEPGFAGGYITHNARNHWRQSMRLHEVSSGATKQLHPAVFTYAVVLQ